MRGMGGEIKGQIRVHYLVESYFPYMHEFEGKKNQTNIPGQTM